MEVDMVNQPPHYAGQGEVECIDVMRQIAPAAFEEHCRLTAFKYVWRANDKGDREQDLKKAVWYLRMAVGDDPRAD